MTAHRLRCGPLSLPPLPYEIGPLLSMLPTRTPGRCGGRPWSPFSATARHVRRVHSRGAGVPATTTALLALPQRCPRRLTRQRHQRLPAPLAPPRTPPALASAPSASTAFSRAKVLAATARQSRGTWGPGQPGLLSAGVLPALSRAQPCPTVPPPGVCSTSACSTLLRCRCSRPRMYLRAPLCRSRPRRS